MQKARRALAQIAGRFLFIGISVQIVLGICWMIRAYDIFPEFGDSYLWLKAADTLVCDDYMGIGYPLFLMLAKGIESISSIPYPFFVYTVQILFAFYSGVVFLRSCGMTKRVWLVWGSLGLLTYPFALRCHVAVLPNSPGFSFLLLELSVLMGILRQDADSASEKFPLRQMFTAGVWWALGTVFVVENLWLGLVPLAVVWFLHLIRGRHLGKQRVLGELVLLAAVAGILFMAVSLWQTPGSYGKAENTVSAAMMRRFTWSHMRVEREYDTWPEELRSLYSWEEIQQSGRYAGTMEADLQKRAEETLGVSGAQQLFRKYAAYHLKAYFSENIHQIAWDMAGYVMPPVMLQLLLDGRGYDSYTARNVDLMMTGALQLTNFLLKYSSVWFLLGSIVALLGALAGKKRIRWDAVCMCDITALGMVIWYTMQDAGCWDYKNGLLPGMLWLVGMILVAYHCLTQEE